MDAASGGHGHHHYHHVEAPVVQADHPPVDILSQQVSRNHVPRSANIMGLFTFILLGALLFLGFNAHYSHPYTLLSTSSSSSPKYHPIVIWHGLGDSAFSEPMHQVRGLLEDTYPGIFVHLVHIADDVGSDQRAGIFGDVNEQIELVCHQFAQVPQLENGFDAIGFSQGGQFLRAYVERCNSPPVRNLVTFGSQHQGIADLPACKPVDILCRLAESAMRAGVYSNYAQHHVVSAQYFRNPLDKHSFQDYLSKNAFLADIPSAEQRTSHQPGLYQAAQLSGQLRHANVQSGHNRLAQGVSLVRFLPRAQHHLSRRDEDDRHSPPRPRWRREHSRPDARSHHPRSIAEKRDLQGGQARSPEDGQAWCFAL
ncbi:hypothetical protein V8E36_004910 [Tilletia maclaganii]